MKNKRFLLLSCFICVNTIYSYANIVEKTFFYDGIAASIQQHALLTISLPFWKSWWLTAFMALIVTLVIFFYIRLRTNSLINQNIQLEEKVNLMTNQLQDKNTELSNSMENQRRLQNQLIISDSSFISSSSSSSSTDNSEKLFIKFNGF